MAERESGWYPHPDYPEDERWWDGAQWVGSRPGGYRERPPTPPPSLRPRSVKAVLLMLALMVAAYFGLWYLVAHTSEPELIPGPMSGAAALEAPS